jgi:hypothetical protein
MTYYECEECGVTLTIEEMNYGGHYCEPKEESEVIYDPSKRSY